jgi:type IV secretory pathway VirB10-like protein
MTALRALAAACLCTLSLAAAAQWQWIDKDGRKVFSDQPPPPDVPAKNILRQPGQRSAQPAAEAAAAPASAPVQAAAPKVSGRDKELEQRKKQAEAAEAEKKKAQEAEVAAQREENCKRARQAKASFDSGVKIAAMNDKGERQVLDDKQRATEVARIEQVISSECAKS